MAVRNERRVVEEEVIMSAQKERGMKKEERKRDGRAKAYWILLLLDVSLSQNHRPRALWMAVKLRHGPFQKHQE
jgi:hypothetical protein